MNQSFIIRPAVLEDLPKLIELLGTLEHSLTSMPQDESVLEKRIHRSIQAFYPDVSEAGSEQYLFMLEDASTGKVLGTSAIIARIGGYEPFYTYRIQNETFEHSPLDIHKNIDVLHLAAEHDGPSELGSLYLHPDYRKAGLGRLLSLSRILFMSQFPNRFRERVIAEFRGWVDENGNSPFWDCVGHHFFEREFDEADFLSGIGNKAFIRDLMPEYPIYIPLLPHSVQRKIGKVHRDTEPAMAILKKEGLQETNAVDIFDAGPMLEGQLSEMRIQKSCRNVNYSVVPSSKAISADSPEAVPYLVSNGSLKYRCAICYLPASETDQHSIELPETIVENLQLEPEQELSIVSLKPQAKR